MARRISWYERLAEIHRQVSESPRTPYTRDDIRKLFHLRLASAKDLVRLMPRFEQQNSAVVEREDLLDFLGQCIDAEDLSTHIEAIRKSPPRPRRRKLHVFVPREFRPGDPDTFSGDIRFSRNEVNILFGDAQDLISKMYQILTVIEDQEFQRRYCDAPEPTPQQRSMSAEKQTVTLEARYCAKLIAARKASAEGDKRAFAARLSEASDISIQIRSGLPPLPADDYLFTAEQALAVLSGSAPVPSSVRIALPASSAPPGAVTAPRQERGDKCA